MSDTSSITTTVNNATPPIIVAKSIILASLNELLYQ
jgi:hypothetical protein